MSKRLIELFLCVAVFATFSFRAAAQNPQVSPRNISTMIEGGTCSPTLTGRPSKLVESIRGDRFEEFKKLIEAGDDVNGFDWDIETPLSVSVTYDRIEYLRELIKAHADVNHADSLGLTPLILAALRGRVAHVALLLQAGADVNHEDKDGQTALLRAARDADLPMVEILLAAGANLHHQDNRGRTALLMSAEGGKAATMRKMLSLGFDPNSYSYGGYTALVGASRDAQMLKMLITAGAKVNLQIPVGGGQSMTALEVAAQNGWTASVRVLLEAGANPNLYYTPQVLPLDRAVRRPDNQEIVEMLKRAGAKTWVEMEKQ
jgi:uncharacterized protein